MSRKINPEPLFTTLVTTQQLLDGLHDPNWIIVDCRFDLPVPEWGLTEYRKAHIPGAIYAHLNRDLSGVVTPATGRHPLPSPEEFSTKLSQMGISNSSQVIVYDASGGSYAARLWWMLKWLGHERVAVLDGGFQKWINEGLPVQDGIERKPPTNFSGSPQPGQIANIQEIELIIEEPEGSKFLLIDARSPVRFRGEREPVDSVPGHIPGAINRFHGDNLGPDGTFLSAQDLKTQFEALLHGISPENAIVYCGSGVTSCHDLLAMQLAGLPGARLYPGSWSEWIRDPSHPRATG